MKFMMRCTGKRGQKPPQEWELLHAPGFDLPPSSLHQAKRQVLAWRNYNQHWEYELVVDGEVVPVTEEPEQLFFVLFDSEMLKGLYK